MNLLKAGFSRVNITPMMGIAIVGYYKPRFASGVLDDLYINALALSVEDKKALLISVDHCGIKMYIIEKLVEHISEVTGLPKEAIFISATHTHTGPVICEDKIHYPDLDTTLPEEYFQLMYRKIADAAVMALADLKPAKMGWGIGEAPNIAFVRRFRMKDGSVRTNPGVDNPDIVAPIGDVDERVSVVRFDREGAETIVLVNFADHPDTVGGDKISADWPGLARATVEKVLDNTKCVLFNGAQGDVNHVNVHPRGGYLNGMFMDFDDVARGYDHAKYMGRVVAGGVLQAFDKVKYEDVDTLHFAKKKLQIPANLATPEELANAHYIKGMYDAGRDTELPYEGMMLTTVVAEALRMVRLENGPDSFEMPLSVVTFGKVAMVGVPGEPFTGIGRGLKAAEDWDLVLPCCLTNGSEGYFPMQEAYDEGGYEARSSIFKGGVAELIIKEGNALLNDLKKG